MLNNSRHSSHATQIQYIPLDMVMQIKKKRWVNKSLPENHRQIHISLKTPRLKSEVRTRDKPEQLPKKKN